MSLMANQGVFTNPGRGGVAFSHTHIRLSGRCALTDSYAHTSGGYGCWGGGGVGVGGVWGGRRTPYPPNIYPRGPRGGRSRRPASYLLPSPPPSMFDIDDVFISNVPLRADALNICPIRRMAPRIDPLMGIRRSTTQPHCSPWDHPPPFGCERAASLF